MERKEIELWLPDGYGIGTIVYDRDNLPYETVGKAIAGVNIKKVVPVEVEYAKRRIAQGAQVLISE